MKNQKQVRNEITAGSKKVTDKNNETKRIFKSMGLWKEK